MSERISQSMRRAIAERAQGCCEYCGMPDDVPTLAHEPDHIIATHRDSARRPNLTGQSRVYLLSLQQVQRPNLTSIGPDTSQITRLFSPRTDVWREHFRWDGAIIIPVTAIGRATVTLLRCNDSERVTVTCEPHASGTLSIRNSLISLIRGVLHVWRLYLGALTILAPCPMLPHSTTTRTTETGQHVCSR